MTQSNQIIHNTKHHMRRIFASDVVPKPKSIKTHVSVMTVSLNETQIGMVTKQRSESMTKTKLKKAVKTLENKTKQKVIMVRINKPWGEVVATTADQQDHIIG